MDPLSLLRTFAMSNQLDLVVEMDEMINFGDSHSFDMKDLTAYKSDHGKGAFYDLQSVLYFLKEIKNHSFTDYFKAAKDAGLMQVKLLDYRVRE